MDRVVNVFRNGEQAEMSPEEIARVEALLQEAQDKVAEIERKGDPVYRERMTMQPIDPAAIRTDGLDDPKVVNLEVDSWNLNRVLRNAERLVEYLREARSIPTGGGPDAG